MIKENLERLYKEKYPAKEREKKDVHEDEESPRY